ncbi:unnamed protein product [Rangifer tarandus platyrhynchus]|uniref:Uncharacterized protein n=1 Tax=Rangifer tarandus platyrhynchus TaxID=3082113 RepID=A0ABN8XLK4_RANTA|nr:unnamed protein product [Rangifer tarandus platyrhynchus]
MVSRSSISELESTAFAQQYARFSAVRCAGKAVIRVCHCFTRAPPVAGTGCEKRCGAAALEIFCSAVFRGLVSSETAPAEGMARVRGIDQHVPHPRTCDTLRRRQATHRRTYNGSTCPTSQSRSCHDRRHEETF